MPTISGIIETALYVDHMKRSVEFYRDLFDFEPLFVSDRLTSLRVAPGQVLLILARGLSAEASVMPFGVIPPSDASGDQHIAFGVRPEEMGQWRARLEQRGIAVESVLNWPEGGQSLYFRDPDHHCIEVKSSDWNGEPLPRAVDR